MVKNLPAMQETQVLGLPGLGGSPGKGNSHPPCPVFLPREFHEQRSLSGYSPWGRKESDTTEMTNSVLALNFF